MSKLELEKISIVNNLFPEFVTKKIFDFIQPIISYEIKNQIKKEYKRRLVCHKCRRLWNKCRCGDCDDCGRLYSECKNMCKYHGYRRMSKKMQYDIECTYWYKTHCDSCFKLWKDCHCICDECEDEFKDCRGKCDVAVFPYISKLLNNQIGFKYFDMFCCKICCLPYYECECECDKCDDLLSNCKNKCHISK